MHFSWVTDIPLTEKNITQVMQGGRARWKIENETFNTLKNQGYNFEHNYGHGNENLFSVLSMLMMLAFLIDQVQLLCSPQFQKAKKATRIWSILWSEMQFIFRRLILTGWSQLFDIIADEKLIFNSG